MIEQVKKSINREKREIRFTGVNVMVIVVSVTLTTSMLLTVSNLIISAWETKRIRMKAKMKILIDYFFSSGSKKRKNRDSL